MRKIFKMVAIASLLVIILVVSIGSVAMAAGPNHDGTCPNYDCPSECPKCSCDGDQHQHRNGQQDPNGGAYRHQYGSCWVEQLADLDTDVIVLYLMDTTKILAVNLVNKN